MKKPIILDFSIYQTYSSILKNESFTPQQYLELVTLVINLLLRGNPPLYSRVDAITIAKTFDNSVFVSKELLNKTLYYMDATVSLDNANNVHFSLSGIYYQQILSLLYILSQGKKTSIKPDFDIIPFYERVYTSICGKLKLEGDTEFLFFLHNLRKKSKVLATKLFSIIGPKDILEIKLYSKYDNFDQEYCSNYRFVISESNNTDYPVGSYVFGTIQPDKSTVILYKNPECTVLM